MVKPIIYMAFLCQGKREYCKAEEGTFSPFVFWFRGAIKNMNV